MPEAAQAKRKRLLAEFYAQPEVRAFFQAAGARGGKVGGKLRTAAMTPEQRRESARKAARARWSKKKAFS